MIKGKFNIIVGAQAGSESKGKLAAWITDKSTVAVDILAGSFSPNAGHTVVYNLHKYVTHHFPAAAIVGNQPIILGPASVINVDILLQDITSCGININRLKIDPRASIITKEMIEFENQNLISIGSTAQGVGVARCKKLMRIDVLRASDIKLLKPYLCSTQEYVISQLKRGATILYEMTQGFDLCMEHGIDPIYCTSRIINPQEAMAEMGVGLKWLGDIYGVVRPYPIRVNNRTGSSGPYAGAKEITWSEIKSRCNAPFDITEYTTTTQLPRRVFEFNDNRFQMFVDICTPTYMCLQFSNYIDWEVYRKTTLSDKVKRWISNLEGQFDVKVMYVGTGPEHNAMVNRE